MAVIARAGDIIFVGLEEENIKRMKADLPFAHSMREVGKPFELVIYYGENYDALVAKMREAVGPDTVIEDMRQRKKN